MQTKERPSICSFCKAELEISDNFCSQCGRRTRTSLENTDFEIGRIAALRESRRDVLLSFGAIAILVSFVGLFAIHESVVSQVSRAVEEQLSSAVSESRLRIRGDEEAMQRSLRESQLSFASQIARLEAGLQGEMSELSALKVRADVAIGGIEARALQLENAEARADELANKLQGLIAAIDEDLLVEDLISSFYAIRDVEVYSFLRFRSEAKRLFDEADDRFFFQVNLLEDGEPFLQFRPSGNAPIYFGDSEVSHQHVLYQKYLDVYGAELASLDRVDRLEVKFFVSPDRSPSRVNEELIDAILGVSVVFIVNGVPMLHLDYDSREADLRDRLSSGADNYFIYWEFGDGLSFEEIYRQRLRSSWTSSEGARD